MPSTSSFRSDVIGEGRPFSLLPPAFADCCSMMGAGELDVSAGPILDVGVGMGISTSLGFVMLAGVGDGAAFFWKKPKSVC